MVCIMRWISLCSTRSPGQKLPPSSRRCYEKNLFKVQWGHRLDLDKQSLHTEATDTRSLPVCFRRSPTGEKYGLKKGPLDPQTELWKHSIFFRQKITGQIKADQTDLLSMLINLNAKQESWVLNIYSALCSTAHYSATQWYAREQQSYSREAEMLKNKNLACICCTANTILKTFHEDLW